MSEFIQKIRAWSHHQQKLSKRGFDASQVLKDVIGVYSSHPTGPLSLFARIHSFDAKSFNQLDRNRLAFRVPAMRLSAYMVPSENAAKISAATLPSPTDPVWENRYSHKDRKIPVEHYEDWKRQVLTAALKPLSAKEIKERTEIPDEAVKPVLNRMAFERLLFRVGAESLRSNIISYVSTAAWVEEYPLFNRVKALKWLAQEYLKAFGPARVKDFQWWVGITSEMAKMVMEACKTENIGEDHLLLISDMDDFGSFDHNLGDCIDILPQWDCYTMGYAPDGRSRFVDQDEQDKIYGSLGATGGNALGTVLLNGLACASWSSRIKGNQMLITLDMFSKPSRLVQDQIKVEFEKIAEFLNAKNVTF